MSDTAPPACFLGVFAWAQPFLSFHPVVVRCMETANGSCFVIQLTSLCLLIGQLRSLIRVVIERYVFMLVIVFILQCWGWRVFDCFHLLLNCCSSMVVWSCRLMDRFGSLFFLKDPFQSLLWNWHIGYEFFSSIFIMEGFDFGILISVALLGIIIWVAVFQNVEYTVPSLSDFQSLG